MENHEQESLRREFIRAITTHRRLFFLCFTAIFCTGGWFIAQQHQRYEARVHIEIGVYPNGSSIYFPTQEPFKPIDTFASMEVFLKNIILPPLKERFLDSDIRLKPTSASQIVEMIVECGRSAECSDILLDAKTSITSRHSNIVRREISALHQNTDIVRKMSSRDISDHLRADILTKSTWLTTSKSSETLYVERDVAKPQRVNSHTALKCVLLALIALAVSSALAIFVSTNFQKRES